MAKRTLKALIRDIGSDLLVLSKTKVPINKIKKKKLESLGFYNLDFVNPYGKKEGIVMGWKMGVEVETIYKSANMVNSLIFSDSVDEPWLISLVYGPPNCQYRSIFWEAIKKVGESFNGSWLCIGDFNHELN